jgi:hypothetical protein
MRGFSRLNEVTETALLVLLLILVLLAISIHLKLW